MKTIWGVAGAAALAFALAGCGGGAEASQPPSPTRDVTALMKARVDCNLTGKNYADLGDAGRTITLQSESRHGTGGLPVDDVMCVLKKTSVPDSVVAQIQGTRALDGTQKAAWDKFQASWTYHPDNGLRVVLTESK